MAAGPKTLAELVKINNENLSGGVADELLEAAPLVAAMAAMPASNGTDHHWLRYDDAPPTGFRDVNDGFVQGSSADTSMSASCKILEASYTADTKVAQGYRFGAEAYLERENMRHLRSAFARLEKQVINGTAGSGFSDANGFEGFIDTNDATMQKLAGGSTNLSSVWLVRSLDPMDSAAIITGQDGNIEVSPAVRQRVPGATGHYHAYCVEIASWYVYQAASKYSTYRIANVDTQAATPVVTDDLLAEAISAFPADRQPNLIVMNRPCLRQLRESRTATNQTGAPAPFPSESYGIRIVLTDQIATDETAVV